MERPYVTETSDMVGNCCGMVAEGREEGAKEGKSEERRREREEAQERCYAQGVEDRTVTFFFLQFNRSCDGVVFLATQAQNPGFDLTDKKCSESAATQI